MELSNFQNRRKYFNLSPLYRDHGQLDLGQVRNYNDVWLFHSDVHHNKYFGFKFRTSTVSLRKTFFRNIKM